MNSSSHSAGQLSRRTVVGAAAWSAPVIATSVALPAYAASETTELFFSAADYSIAACAFSPEIWLHTAGTKPAASTPVVVTLPEPMAFADGKNVFYTDAAGSVRIPARAFRAPAVAHTGTMSADLGEASATATLTFVPVATAHLLNLTSGSATTYPVVAADAAVIGGYNGFGGRSWATFLGANGDLYFQNARLATGVTSAFYAQDAANGNRSTVVYMAGGRAFVYASPIDGGSPTTTALPNVPAGSTAVGLNSFLRPDGTLTYKDIVVATGVTSVGFDQGTSTHRDYLTYVANGSAFLFIAGTVNRSYPVQGLPADVVVAGSDTGIGGWAFTTFLTPSGDLYFGASESTFTVNRAVLVASGVTSAVYTQGESSNDEYLTYISNGTGYQARGNPLVTASSPRTALRALPSGSKVVG